MDALSVLAATYAPVVEFAGRVDDDTGWAPSRLPGWSVRDLLFHLATDCQRALVALATPADRAADTDEVSYWTTWQPGTTGARDGLRGVRIQASAWASVRGPAGLFAETARAVVVAAERVDPAEIVSTQGRTLSITSLLRTLTVEAAVHHLDLGAALPAAPTYDALDEVGHVLDALAAAPRPLALETVRWVLIGTGRDTPTEAERDALGPAVLARLPLFG